MKLLENDLIKLRALEPEDLEILYKWENDTDLWQYGATIAPYSKFVLREYLSDSRQDIFQSRQLRLIIELKKNAQAAGTVDLYDFDPMNARAGVGILIDCASRGKGIGYAALSLIERYAFDFLKLKQLYAYIPQHNIASLHLFSASGYVKAGFLKSWIRVASGFDDVNVVQLVNPGGDKVN